MSPPFRHRDISYWGSQPIQGPRSGHRAALGLRTPYIGNASLEPGLETFRGRDGLVERIEHDRIEVVRLVGPQHRVTRVDQEAVLAARRERRPHSGEKAGARRVVR